MKRHLRIQARSVSCSTSLENLKLEALAAYTNHAEVPIYKPRLTTKLKNKRHLLIQARAFPAQPLLEHLELEALPAYTNLAEVPISTPTEESTKKTSQETPFDPGKKCFLLNLTRKPRVGSINCLHQPRRGSNLQAKTNN